MSGIDRAQADSLGSLLLVTVVVVSAVTFGGYYVTSGGGGGAGGAAGGAGGAAGISAEFALSATEGELRLSHDGGSSLSADALEVTVADGGGETTYRLADGTLSGGSGDGTFDPGETWTLAWNRTAGATVTVALVDADSGTRLFSETATVESTATGGSESAEGSDDGLIVDAGPERSVAGERGASVGLNATVGGATGAVEYRWRIVDYGGLPESAVELTDAGSPNATVEVRENVTRSNHTVSVQVTASDSVASDVDRTAVTVLARNRPPVADAGDDVALEGVDGGERASGDDSEDGREADDRGGRGPPDNLGQRESDSLLPPVRAVAPVGAAAADDGDGGDPQGPFVELNGTGSYDPDGDDLGYEWSIVDTGGLSESALRLVGADTPTPRFVLLAPRLSETRVATVQLTVTDPAGATARDRVNVTMYPDVGPTIESTSLAPERVVLDGESVDVDVSVNATHPTDELRYDYRVGGGVLDRLLVNARAVESAGSEARLRVSPGPLWLFVPAGDEVRVPVTIRVTDGDGDRATETVFVRASKR